MKLGEIYKKAISTGIENDPRGKARVLQVLKKAEKDFAKLEGREKENHDKEKLTNPYADTRILYGDHGREIISLLAGIDMEVGEVLVAQMLALKGRKVDLVLSHHPQGSAFAAFYEVMDMQADIFNKYGVPINVMEGLLGERMNEVRQKIMPSNHQRGVDIAKLFDIPIMCIHTPADNCVATFLQKIFDRERPEILDGIMSILEGIPEYKQAAEQKNGPSILIGSKEKRCGRIMVDMTGGTEGSKNVFEKLSNTDVGTLVVMHMGSEHKKEAEKNHINVVIAGHIASDNLGLNIMLDSVTGKEKLSIIPVSGFRRIERNKRKS